MSDQKDLWVETGFRRYFANFSWLMLEKVGRFAIQIIVTVYIARFLGVEQFGVLNYAISFVGLLVIFSSLGIDSVAVKWMVESKYEVSTIIGTAFWLKFTGSLIIFFILFFSFIIQEPGSYKDENILIVLISFGLIFNAFAVIDFFYQYKVLSKYVVFSQLIQLVISSILKITLVLSESHLLWFGFAVMLDSVLLAIGLVYFYKKTEKKFNIIDFNMSVAIELLKVSWPLIVSGFAISIYMKIDQVMLKHMVDDVAVGNYAAAAKLVEIWYMVPIILSTSFFPAILKAAETNKKVFATRMNAIFFAVFWYGVIVSILVWYFSDTIVFSLFGSAYKDAATVLAVYVWILIFVGIGLCGGKWMISENLQKTMMYRSILGAILNIFLNIIFIPAYGVVGAAIATLMSQVFIVLILDVFSSKTRKMFGAKIKSIYSLPRIV